MQTIETVLELKQLAADWRAAGKSIALVPTMGALHAGQEALIKAAVEQADVVVVTSIINPLQFAPNENTSAYPRTPEKDQEMCSEAGVSVLFVPAVDEILPPGSLTFVDEDRISRTLCGVSRPTHFRGVATLTAKLLNIVRPQWIYFGQKTAQRVAVIRKMITDLDYEVEVVVVPTVREADGLACSTCNGDFTSNQRNEALAISRAMDKVKEMVGSGVSSPDRLVAEATHILGDFRQVRVIYIAVVDRDTMESVRVVEPGKCLLAISVWINEIRVVDNTLL